MQRLQEPPSINRFESMFAEKETPVRIVLAGAQGSPNMFHNVWLLLTIVVVLPFKVKIMIRRK